MAEQDKTKTDKIKIEFFRSKIVPASAFVGADAEPKNVMPYEPVMVKATYGLSVIADKFAQKSDKPLARKAVASKKTKQQVPSPRKPKQTSSDPKADENTGAVLDQTKDLAQLETELSETKNQLVSLIKEVEAADPEDKPAIGLEIETIKQQITDQETAIAECQTAAEENA